MQVFVAVGEEEGFAAAARRLDISPAAVTRAIAALERQLGVQLLLRTTRNMRLTEAGTQYFNDARAILSSLSEANEAAAGVHAQPRGVLSLTASVMFGRMFVMPCITRYMRRYPQVSVNSLFVDRVVNMVEEGLDVAIRIGHLRDSSLRAVRVGRVRCVLCASPEYLSAHGTPRHPQDLPQHAILAASGISPSVDWRFGCDSEPVTVRVAPRLVINNNDAARQAAIDGLGITRLLSYMVAEDVQQGRLKILLEAYEQESWPVQVVHREGRFCSAKVRAFIDCVIDDLRGHPLLEP